MYGILTSSPAVVRENIGDFVHYISDDVSGRRRTPLDGVINSVACWGDTKAVHDDPSRAAVAADGTRAKPETEGYHWGTVCPTDPDYRAGLLDRLETIGANDVRLTTLGFPGPEFCRCERCERQFETSDRDERVAWRTETVTRFVQEVSNRVSGDVIVTLYPDPYPGNLRERAGLDPQKLGAHVDGFLVPLCSISYETTYWVEALARGFARELGDLDVPLTIQLSASDAEVDRLVDVTRQIDSHADAVVYGTREENFDTVQKVIRRCQASEPLSKTV